MRSAKSGIVTRRNAEKVAETVEFYRRNEVVSTFEADRYGTARGRLRLTLQNDMALELMRGTADPLLEIAGGSGRFSRQFASQKRVVTVVDASPAMLESNRSSLGSAAAKVTHLVGLAGELPLKSESFQTLFCVDMFSHIRKPQPIVHEMARVLRRGGHLVVNFTNRSSLMGIGATFFSNPLRRLLGRMGVYSTYHRARGFLRLIDSAGFRRLRTTGLFLIDPRLYRFEFGKKFSRRALALERWASRKDCPPLYEQIWVKAERL